MTDKSKGYSIVNFTGYTAEVSEPNKPAINAYITARWAYEVQKKFDEWLEKHDADLRNEILDKVLNPPEPAYVYEEEDIHEEYHRKEADYLAEYPEYLLEGGRRHD